MCLCWGVVWVQWFFFFLFYITYMVKQCFIYILLLLTLIDYETSFYLFIYFGSNMGISELYTPHASIGALWWYLIMISELLVLQCVHYKISLWDEENLTFIFQFPRFETGCLFLWFCLVLLISIHFYVMHHSFSTLFQDNPSEKDINQGTLVVFNLDPSVSNDDLRQIFGAYGEVKEVLPFGCVSFTCCFVFIHSSLLCILYALLCLAL